MLFPTFKETYVHNVHTIHTHHENGIEDNAHEDDTMLSLSTQSAIHRAITQSCFPDTCTITAPGTLAQPGITYTAACRVFTAEERYYQHSGAFLLATSFRFEVPADCDVQPGSVLTVHGTSYTVDRVLGLRLDGVLQVKARRLRADK